MKKNIVILISFLFSFSGFSQTISWAKSATGTGLDEGNAIVVDNNGYTYITGSFESATLTFGTQTINNTSPGTSDIFVAKFDLNGNCLWAKNVGGFSDEYSTAITVEKNTGVVYVAGHFNSTSVTFNGSPINNNGYSDLILLKYNTSGVEQWGKGFGGVDEDQSTGLSIDQNNNVYLTGHTWGGINFGSTTILNNGAVDLFIAKFNSSGTNLWAKGIGGSGSDRATSIKTIANGESYITGFFDSPTITFGSNTPLTNGSFGDDYLFVAKYDASGTAIWSKSASSVNGGVWGNSISTDNNNDVYITGCFDGTSMTIANVIGNSNPSYDNVFVAKYSSNGVEQWVVNPTSGPEGNEAYCITTDNLNNVYISGWYTSPSINFGGIILTSTAAGDNIFLAKYNSSGVIQNAYSFRGAAASGGYGNGICADNNGNIYLTGYFEGVNMTFNTVTLTNTGSYDVYWTKFGLGTTSVTELEKQNTFHIYPNPFNVTATIITKDYLTNATLKILSINGKLVKEFTNLNGKSILIDRFGLENGIYVIQLTNNNVVETRKLILN